MVRRCPAAELHSSAPHAFPWLKVPGCPIYIPVWLDVSKKISDGQLVLETTTCKGCTVAKSESNGSSSYKISIARKEIVKHGAIMVLCRDMIITLNYLTHSAIVTIICKPGKWHSTSGLKRDTIMLAMLQAASMQLLPLHVTTLVYCSPQTCYSMSYRYKLLDFKRTQDISLSSHRAA